MKAGSSAAGSDATTGTASATSAKNMNEEDSNYNISSKNKDTSNTSSQKSKKNLEYHDKHKEVETTTHHVDNINNKSKVEEDMMMKVENHVKDKTEEDKTEVYFVYGPMFAGKTTLLISLAQKLEENGERVLVIRPCFDTRYNDGRLRSHPQLTDPQFKMAQEQLRAKLRFERQQMKQAVIAKANEKIAKANSEQKLQQGQHAVLTTKSRKKDHEDQHQEDDRRPTPVDDSHGCA